MERVLAQWGVYLEERFGGAACSPVQLPVIPLGLGCAALAPETPAAEAARAFCPSVRALFLDGRRPELRRGMGAAGRRRAEALFDWRVVIAAYQELWRELAESRRAADESVPRHPRAPADPLRDDPFTLFADYPTGVIGLDAVVSLAATADTGKDTRARLAELRALRMNAFAAGVLAPDADHEAALRHLAERGPCAVSDLLALVPEDRARLMHRTLGWLAKYGLVRIVPRAP